jgi:membrane-bound acyltransferase YfiQ involved in biofilm formation
VGLKVKIGNKALKFMSAITLEFYLVHGLFVELFAFRTLDNYKPLLYINNAFFYGMAVLVCAIPFSLLLRKAVHPKAKFLPAVKK